MSKPPVTAVVVGAGHRSYIYADYAKLFPDELQIVAVADPDPARRQLIAARHGLGPEQCYDSAEALAARGRLADAAINGTMDRLHVPTSLPLLEQGYDLLLEKPFALNETEMVELVAMARRHHNRVMICHVLRFAPFYVSIQARIAAGELGDLVSVQLEENVSYDHIGVSYVRGKWANRHRCGAPMILAKASHDLDLMLWLNRARPMRVASLGEERIFHPSMRPEGATARCYDPCPLIETCPWSAKTSYAEHPDRWPFYVWDGVEDPQALTMEQRIHYLHVQTDWDRCVWDSGRDNVDHQSVTVQFGDRSMGAFCMTGGTAKSDRTINVIGTRGQIVGELSTGRYLLRRIDPRVRGAYEEVEVDAFENYDDLQGGKGRHGGGDLRLVQDFVRYVRGEEVSASATTLDDSITGHLLAMKADEAMRQATIVDMDAALAELEAVYAARRRIAAAAAVAARAATHPE